MFRQSTSRDYGAVTVVGYVVVHMIYLVLFGILLDVKIS
jgi:hypothetical protein